MLLNSESEPKTCNEREYLTKDNTCVECDMGLVTSSDKTSCTTPECLNHKRNYVLPNGDCQECDEDYTVPTVVESEDNSIFSSLKTACKKPTCWPRHIILKDGSC